ncbi:uncharacterized protein LOC111695757 [Eurytemora carolleeae]|uniref:uncharacterized protein LOC111695757 n=1 Tax=Eurytemora carolleeae TaxID=1294199 RepID=UPI000C75CED1|nr:uncharacterized protein LOC111695757 [Eurytemora carolleeae]|eukprot:XP_023320951.1 uncharacterized protein LOC111695757 [Eurytemora affinis]
MCPFLSYCSSQGSELEEETCCSSVRCWSEVNSKFGEPGLIKGRGGELCSQCVLKCRVAGGSAQSFNENRPNKDDDEKNSTNVEELNPSSLLSLSMQKERTLTQENLYKRMLVNHVRRRSEELIREEILKVFQK